MAAPAYLLDIRLCIASPTMWASIDDDHIRLEAGQLMPATHGELPSILLVIIRLVA